jgi:hypothetical protein
MGESGAGCGDQGGVSDGVFARLMQ